MEEISSESDYSFGGLLDERAVKWKNRACTFYNRRGYPTQLYSKFNAESDMTFLVMQTAIEDTRIYLWNAEQKECETVQIPEDFSECSRYTEYFPETKSIWRGDHNLSYADDAEREDYCDGVDYTEILWKWEGTTLVKQRECMAEVREEDVKISAYEGSSSNILFDETFTREEWEQNSMKVQKLYQQFYAEMVPEGNGGYLHTIDYDQESKEYIPQALLDTLTKAMLDKTESETLKGLVNDKELTGDEILEIAKDNLAMRSDVIEADWSGSYTMVIADADNDGIMDIVAEEFFGGTGEFTEYVFYKGQEDGTYQKTSSYDAVWEEFAIISYDGKNYLCRTLYDYTKKFMTR